MYNLAPIRYEQIKMKNYQNIKMIFHILGKKINFKRV